MGNDDGFIVEIDPGTVVEDKVIIEEPEIGNKDTDELLNEFILSGKNVGEYEKARVNYYRFKNWFPIIVIFGYLLSIILYAWGEEGGILEMFAPFLLIISLIIGGLVFILRHIFKNRAENQDITPEEATYHRLATAIMKYRDESSDIDQVESNLRSVRNLLSQGRNQPFNTPMNDDMISYLENIEKSESDAVLRNSFPVLANKMIRYLSVLQKDPIDEFLQSYLESEIQSGEPTTKRMVESYFRDLLDNRILKISSPFILSAPLLLMIYIYVGQTAAQFVLLAVIAISQIYYNISDDS
ncbi:hypothetical protein SAMN04487967_1698 [Natronorubrum sediminis]|uniref:Uncharacterized protein n=1 Tax=Natronorubrum sediminis TaxID=640943 RepID=A0A1H6FV24_9EURY|nr:hypothetical protein [Natronorubrum sediminis]SEH14639.1 hypothetical protein SAMN04487967_1698 [Natronorubrum sediminis]